MSILAAWSPFFHSSARMQGRAHSTAGRVERVEPAEGELVRAHVQDAEADNGAGAGETDDNEATHLVTVRQVDRRAEADCTCAHFENGAYCKHIWATLLDVQHEEGPGASSQVLAKLQVRAPKARKRAGAGRRPMRDTEPEWMGRLSLLRPASYDESNAPQSSLPTQRQLCYVLRPGASERAQRPVIELRQRTPTATGWSKAKPLKIDAETIATLTDPDDRELCAMLLGGVPAEMEIGAASSRGGSTYRLPPSAWRTLIKRMIATGRCFVTGEGDDEENDSDEPLHWDGDQPWTLWLSGRWASSSQSQTEEELLVQVELRRDEQVMPVEQPAMVIGGVDGFVVQDDQAAPLDDRDALRWISHFRDEHRRREEPRPIRVPKDDVKRFLDRLYMLPQLPEIDLPDGVGRVPQHVDPVPHLDLFSPDSSEASQLLPASAKNQLAAKVWFAYDGQRVLPSQPGRFVTVSSSASRTDGQDNGGEAHGVTPWASGAETEEAPQEDTDTQTAEQQTPSDGNDDDGSNGDGNAMSDDGLLIQRNHRAEREAMAQLASQGLRPLSSAGPDALVLAQKQMAETVSQLIAHGWAISADRQLVRHAGAPSLSVTSGVDWFEVRGNVRYERADGTTQDIPLPRILAAARNGDAMIELDDGSQGLLPDQWLSEHGLLTAMGQLEDDHLRFRSSQAAMLDAMLDERELTSVDEPFERLRAQLHKFRGVEEINPAPQFKGSLRAYQRHGLGWMALLRTFGMGGILADDMGLGKTIQVLAMLQMRAKERGDDSQGTHRPTLVVAPRSVVFNWVDEANKFTEDLRVMAYTGGEREQLRAAFDEHDLIVTSYGLLRRDIEALSQQPFDYLILDEAQAIKNPQSQAAKSARLLEGNHRLALTGTPVENHLGDLWSIFEFLNPGMLGAGTRFGELIKSGNGNGNSNSNDPQSADTLQQISRAVRPFILRRTKKQVLDDLPDKTEQTLRCEMEPAQRQVYDELRNYYRSHLLSQLDQAGAGANGGSTIGGKAGFMVLEALLRLRQAACHPGLINEANADDPSAKLDVLMELLEDVSAEGSKALVFSQFTSMLSLVKRRFEERGIRYCYLDGQTRNRREVVHRFQTDPRVNAFLVSLKTGGFGLNLTAAEYVFILDPWWNPAVEQQAIDRTHRIGQTRRVFAYRLICQDTVEQRITELQQKKKQIADAIVGGEQNVLSSLTRDDLEQLLS